MHFQSHIHEGIRLAFNTWLDINGEANAFSWYSSSKFFLAGLLFAFLFIIRGYLSFLLLSIMLVAMSANEGAQIHENLGLLLSNIFFSLDQTVIGDHSVHDWPYLVGPVVLILVAIVILVIIREKVIPRDVTLLMVSGIAILLIGAVGLEIASHKLHISSWWYRPFIAEELFESFGATFLVVGSVRAFMEYHQVGFNPISVRAMKIGYYFIIVISFFTFMLALWFWLFPQNFNAIGFSRSWVACTLPRISGVVLDDCVVRNDPSQKGIMTFGPYVALPSGNYKFSIAYSSSRPSNQKAGRWDVSVDKGKSILKEGSFPGTVNTALAYSGAFSLSQDCNDLELRIYPGPEQRMDLNNISITRLE